MHSVLYLLEEVSQFIGDQVVDLTSNLLRLLCCNGFRLLEFVHQALTSVFKSLLNGLEFVCEVNDGDADNNIIEIYGASRVAALSDNVCQIARATTIPSQKLEAC